MLPVTIKHHFNSAVAVAFCCPVDVHCTCFIVKIILVGFYIFPAWVPITEGGNQKHLQMLFIDVYLTLDYSFKN